MKRFFTTAPRQKVQFESETLIYVPQNCDYLAYPHPCSYPILPVINYFVKEKEAFELVILTAVDGNDNPISECGTNVECLSQKVRELAEEKHLEAPIITQMNIPLGETITTHIDTIMGMIKRFQEGDIIYYDMSYGTKPSMFAELVTLNYAHQAMKNVYVECVVYGEARWENRKITGKFLYDCTNLFYLNQIIHTLSASGAGVSKELIEKILESKSE